MAKVKKENKLKNWWFIFSIISLVLSIIAWIIFIYSYIKYQNIGNEQDAINYRALFYPNDSKYSLYSYSIPSLPNILSNFAVIPAIIGMFNKKYKWLSNIALILPILLIIIRLFIIFTKSM